MSNYGQQPTTSVVYTDEDDEDDTVSRASSSYRVIYTPESSDDEGESGGSVQSTPRRRRREVDAAAATSGQSGSDTPSAFLLEKAQAAFDEGRISEAATLLQVLIRENKVKTVETPASVYVLLADACVLISHMPGLCVDYDKAEEARNRYLADAKIQLDKAEKEGKPDSIEAIRIKVKQCSIAVIRGDQEQAEMLINLAGIMLDKHNKPSKDEQGLRNRKAKGGSKEKYEPPRPRDQSDLYIEIRTIRAMLLSHEDDGYGFRTQHELSPLLHDPRKRRLAESILLGYGYELVPDRHMPAKYIICPRNEEPERKRRRQRLFGENYDEQRWEAEYNLSLAFAVTVFGLWFFLFGLNVFKHVAEPHGLYANAPILFAVVAWWAYLSYLYVSLYGDL